MSKNQHKVLILFQEQLSLLGRHIQSFFSAECVETLDVVTRTLENESFKVVVYDCSVGNGELDLDTCQKLMAIDAVKKIPFIVISGATSLQNKIKAFEVGCDDFIDASITADEACARITKSIFHRIANDQLAHRLEMATETARSAMVDNSDLGANIQFLLSVHSCDNLDQLGQQFFATIGRYGLRCSLQMRSAMEVKNMEPHGMAKDLESQLLTQLSDSGRYIDFGIRTILNYDRVSLLVKNMPVNDSDKYGAIKDNTFYLVQGLNARIIALEDKYRILKEKELLTKLSSDVYNVMDTIKNSYQQVMRDIVNEVENCSELIVEKLPHLALVESDEKFLESVTERVIEETNRIFNEGLVVDRCLEQLEDSIGRAISNFELPSTSDAQPSNENNEKAQAGDIELF